MSNQAEFNIDIAPAYVEGFNTTLEYLAEHSERVYNGADIAWIMVSSALVYLMVAGISLLHSGLSDRRSAISLFRLPLLVSAVVGCQWFLFGYSLAFSWRSEREGWTFWGGTSGLVFHDLLIKPVGNGPGARIPEVVYALFQQMFACFTASIVSGATYRKVPTIQFLFFIVIWTTLVYCPVARWSWHEQGWSRRNFSLDYAGGTVVHIVSGAAVQAFAVWYAFKVWRFGKTEEQRQGKRFAHLDMEHPNNAHNSIYQVLGTILMWIGWFGFNGGSALGANTRAASACMSTQIAACFGAVTGLAWYAIEKLWAKKTKVKGSATGYCCDGALNGLIAITPAAGYVPPEFAPIFGVVAASIIFLVVTFMEIVKENLTVYWLDIVLMQYDVLHIGVVHAGSGMVGMFLTAFLNRPEIFALDGFSSAANYSQDVGQLRHQLLDAVLAWLYSFFVTLGLLLLSTLCKWLICVLRVWPEPWTKEQALDVTTKHMWAAGEAQVSSTAYEEKFIPATGTPSPTRNTTAVDDDFRLGGGPNPARGTESRIANGVPSGGEGNFMNAAGRHDSATSSDEARRDDGGRSRRRG